MPQPADVCLAATCHDPLGRYAAGIRTAAPALGRLFSDFAINTTDETHPDTVEALQTLGAGVLISRHAAGSIGIGTARKDALALALRCGAGRLLYSDLDHVVRWATTDPDELAACVATTGADMVVVGRSARAWAGGPERLRRTESIVNHVFALANNLTEEWDLMIALRLVTRACAQSIVERSQDTAISNDVTWPMSVLASGGTLGYFAGDGIRFLARDDFGAASDARDDDPGEWLKRVATAEQHVRAIVDGKAPPAGFEPAT